jgi:8-oxo-dGTP diphosphatase
MLLYVLGISAVKSIFTTARMSPDVDNPSRTLYPDRPLLAVGAIVFKDSRVLLVQRARPPALGEWAIPGGSVRLGETLQQAAEREILEETGIHIQAREPVFTFDIIERDEHGEVRFHYVIVDLAADYIGGDLRPGDDAAAARWMAAGDLHGINVNARTRELLRRWFPSA